MNQGNALLGIITGINTDHTFIADIYGNGYQYAPTANGVLVNLIDRRFRHKIGDHVLCVRIGPTYYAQSSEPGGSVILGTITSFNHESGEALADLFPDGYGHGFTSGNVIHRLDTETDFTVGDNISAIIITLEDGSKEYWCDNGASGTITIGGTDETQVKNGEVENEMAVFSDVFKIIDGRLCINVEDLYVTNNNGDAQPFSAVMKIINNTLCLRTDAPMSDGTAVAKQEMILDTDVTPNVYRPALSYVKDAP